MDRVGSSDTAYIAVGANIDPEANIVRALESLRERMQITGISTFYITPALERPEQSDYRNGVIQVLTDAPPHELKFDILRGIERRLGRVRSEDPYAAREIDLDILIYGSQVIDLPGLRIPDADIEKRIFLAAPLLELAPDMILPGSTRPLAALQVLRGTTLLTPAPAFTSALEERFLQ